MTVLLSCATEAPPEAQKIENPPFVRRYKNKENELIYVVIQPERNIGPETKTLIETTMRKFDPEVILTKLAPEKVVEHEDEYAACESGQKCSTYIWTCITAKRRGIPCKTAEPYYREIAQMLKKQVPGSTDDDVLFFYTYRGLALARKVELKEIDYQIEFCKNQLNLASTFDRYDFIRTFKDKLNRSSVKIDEQDLVANPEGNYTQRFAHALDNAFVTLTVSRIHKEQTTHKRVMIVYGPAIYFFQKKSIEESFSGHIP